MSAISGGLSWSVSAATATGASIAQSILSGDDTEDAVSTGAYRPSLWSRPAKTYITVPGTSPSKGGSSAAINSSSGQSADDSGTFHVDTTETEGTPDTILVFDAVFLVDHNIGLILTQHSVQNAANISDHAMIRPARIVLEIGMSDVMDSFTPGDWSSNTSKSVSAFETLASLVTSRTPLTLSTRLMTYSNVLVENVSAPDNRESANGLKATVTFQQIFTGSVTTTPVSAREQTTDSTSIGQKQVLSVPDAVTQQNTVTSTSTVPGAGTFTGVSTTGS